MSEEVGEFASQQQIRKLYAVLHSLGISPKEFKQEKGFSSYSKLGRFEISEMIEELEQKEEAVENSVLEELQESQAHAQSQPQVQQQEVAAPVNPIEARVEAALNEVDVLAPVMRACVRTASEAILALPEDIYEEVGEDSLGEYIIRLAVTMFIQVSRRR